MKRPFYIVGFSYFAALILATWMPFSVRMAVAGLCALGFIATLVFRRGKQKGAIRAMLAAACIALCAFTLKEQMVYLPQVTYAGTAQTVTAKVVGFTDNETPCAVLEVQSGGLPRGTKLRLCGNNTAETLTRCDIVTATFQIEKTDDTADKAAFFSFSKADNLYLRGFAENGIRRIGRAAPTLADRFALWQERASAYLRAQFDAEEGAVTAAICLGDRTGLTAATIRAFRNSGVSHLLVVSGLHVSAFAIALYFLLSKCGVPRIAATGIALVALAAFCLFVGGSPSVLRAAILQAVLWIGLCTSRKADGRNSLGLALFLLLIADPYAVYDLGLWFSFGATWGLMVLYPPLRGFLLSKLRLHPLENRWHRAIEWVVSPVCVTIAASLPLLPLTTYVYHTMSWTAPLANLLCVYPAMALLWSGVLMVVLSSIWAPLGFPFRIVSIWLERYLCAVTGALGNNHAAISLTTPYVPLLFAAALIGCFIGYRLKRSRGLKIAAALAVVVWASAALLETAVFADSTNITALDGVGGFSALIERGNRRIVCVAGNEASWDSARFALSARGVDTLDAVLVLHTQAAFDASFDAFTNAIDTEMLVVPDGCEYGGSEGKTVCRISPYNARTATFWGDVRWVACADDIWKMVIGNTRVLFCGDKGNLAALDAEERDTELVIWTGKLPPDASLVTAKLGWIFSPSQTDIRGRLPYATHILTTEGTQRVVTRKDGELATVQ